jgi:DNA-binding transcriptional MerR regulator
MKDIYEREHHIVRGDSYDIAFANYFFGDVHYISESLNEKKHRLEAGTVSYRILNHWEQKGLLSSDRPEGKGWRKYSVIDIIWMHIIIQLREFGYPLEKIFLVKEDLSLGDDPKTPFPILEFYIAFAYTRVPSFLAVFNNGEAIPCKLSEFENSRSIGSLKGDALLISINEILQKMNPNKDLHPDYSTTYDLTKDEVSLLVAIRLHKWSEIKIRGKQGKITMIERTEDVDSDKKIVDILRSGNYQNIEMKQEDGNVVSIKRTIKEKIE